MTILDIFQALSNIIFQTTFDINPTNEKVIQFIIWDNGGVYGRQLFQVEHFKVRLIIS